MEVSLKLIVVLIFITYPFSVVFCQSNSEPRNWKYTRKSETPIRSFRHHLYRKQLQQPDLYNEHLLYLEPMIKDPEIRDAQQWQAAVQMHRRRNKDRLQDEILIGHPRAETKASIQRISRKGNKHLTEDLNDGYFGNRYNVEDTNEASETPTDIMKGPYNITEILDQISEHGNVPKNQTEHRVNIQYALNLELNKRLGDYIRSKVAAIRDKIVALRDAGIPYLK